MVTVTGWGTTSEGGLGLPNVLHKVTFFIGVVEKTQKDTLGVDDCKLRSYRARQHDPNHRGKVFNEMIFVKVTLPVVSDEDCNAAYGAAG